MVIQTLNKITADEFFQLPETNTPMELIDGEIIQMPSLVPNHQDVVLNIAILFRQLAKALGGRVFVSPMDVYFDEINIPQPDVVWLAPNSRCQVGEKRLIGAPDLVAEVLSPGSVSHDRRKKFRLYQQFGVREYWIVDFVEKLIDVFQLVDGKFLLLDVYGAEETFVSPLLGAVVVQEIFSVSG